MSETGRVQPSTEQRIAALIDRGVYQQDAQYHAEVARLRLMLRLAEMALQDEGVAQDVTERVLNRMVYGVPDPGAGYTRQQEMRDQIAAINGGARLFAPARGSSDAD